MHTPAEVGNLELAMDAKEDILGLDVPVHDMLLVEVFESCSHLGDILSCFPLGELVLFPKMLVKFAFVCELEDEEDAF